MHMFDMAAPFSTVDYTMLPAIVLLLIFLALIFDFLNGFHDAANSVATIVSTRVLSPFQAVVWAAFFNFVAFLFFHLSVANTMGRGIIDPKIVNYHVIAGTLIAASLWDIITWHWGLPTSSSHALIGGLVGAALANTGWEALNEEGILKTVLFILLAPMIGFFIGLTIAVAVTWICRNATPRGVDSTFRRGQLLSAAFYSLGHGGNDAQKTMGVMTLALVTAGLQTSFDVPLWVILTSATAMAFGTASGGWRIIRTMGTRLAELQPIHGFVAETTAGIVIEIASRLGYPLSTTHVISSCILGVGASRRLRAVRWSIAGSIVTAWIVTIPTCSALAWCIYQSVRLVLG
jgi:inorganic phosphate transporter, PiT family